ncbi:MAG: UbiX family flavin prenyltransferase [Alphaproteobacteria bacterium]|nr:UbiX family flavin prenyltransferase [Alphaproteobacteria bacterium]
MSRPRKIVVAVTGASGAPYAARVLDFLRDEAAELGLEPHVVFTKFGRLVWADEVGTDPAEAYPFPTYAPGDMMAPFSSGSSGFEAMVVIPCTAAAVARIASGVSSDLVSRAADVMLKERRKLVLVVRESPYSLIHLRNMVAVTEAGAVVMPASPSFYSAPEGVEQLLDTVTARVLDQLGIDNDRMRRWTGALVGHGRKS